MENINMYLGSNYVCTMVKGSPVWKRGTRKADTIKGDIVWNYLLLVASQQRNTLLTNELTIDRVKAIEFIDKWFVATAVEASANCNDEDNGININEYIIGKFEALFIIEPETHYIYLKNAIGKSHYNSTQASDIIMSSIEFDFNNVPKGFSIERVRRTIGNHLTYMHEETRRNNLEKILFIQNDDQFVTDWINKLFNLYHIDQTELNLVMFKHLLYSVKRAVFGMSPPDCRYMFTFFNRQQGAGKTRFVKHLCEPFLPLYTDQGTMNMLMNKNDLKALTAKKMVIDIQELAIEGEFTADSYKAIKSAITSDSVGGRVLYSTTSESQPMLSVFVSSTNIHIADMIRDDTGLRRFYSFDFKNTRKVMNWDVVDNHWKDIYKIYTMVDENGVAPMTDKLQIHAELEVVQEEYKRKSDFILDWQNLTGNKLCTKKEAGSEIVSKIELFNMLQSYCKQYESFNLKMGTMKNLLISRHSIHPKQDVQNSDYYYMIKSKGFKSENEIVLPTIEDNSNKYFGEIELPVCANVDFGD